MKFLLAATASGTVAAWGIWGKFPLGWKFLSATAALAAVAQPIFLSSDRLKKISATLASWKDVYVDYELLWVKDESLSSTDSWEEFEQAKRREKIIDETTLPKRSKLIEQAFQEVLRKRGLPNV